MTYKHLNTQELTFIYHFWKQGTKAPRLTLLHVLYDGVLKLSIVFTVF